MQTSPKKTKPTKATSMHAKLYHVIKRLCAICENIAFLGRVKDFFVALSQGCLFIQGNIWRRWLTKAISL